MLDKCSRNTSVISGPAELPSVGSADEGGASPARTEGANSGHYDILVVIF